MHDNRTYHDLIDRFHQKHVLVIGDLILDVYLKGASTRLSPEAPVAIVDVAEKIPLLGGSANTVCNLRTLGASVTYCTVTGNDADGDTALQLLNNISVSAHTIIRHPDRDTVVKTRVVAGSHVITRFDCGTQTPIDHETVLQLIAHIGSNFHQYDAVIISDYDKGVVTAPLLEAINRLREQHPVFLAVDSKRLPFFVSIHPDLVKPNYDEAVKLLDLESRSTARVDQLIAEGKRLTAKTQAKLIAATLDHDGSLFFENGENVYHAHAHAVALPQVAGAGDTFLSAFTLAYASGGDIQHSAEIASAAAAIAVTKDSTSSCAAAELKNWFYGKAKFIHSLADLGLLCENYRAQGKRIVFTNGCFDILHSGHVTYLHCARELGDVLIVGINTDESITRLKGASRPINALVDRIQVLSGLSTIDHIIPFGDAHDDTPVPVIRVVRPNIFVKGGDYTKDKLPEAAAVEENGGEIVFIPQIPDQSTTAIIRRIGTTTSTPTLTMANS